MPFEARIAAIVMQNVLHIADRGYEGFNLMAPIQEKGLTVLVLRNVTITYIAKAAHLSSSFRNKKTAPELDIKVQGLSFYS